MARIFGRCHSGSARPDCRGCWPAWRQGSSLTSTPTQTGLPCSGKPARWAWEDRVKAADGAISLRAFSGLDQGQEPGQPGNAAGARWAAVIGDLNQFFAPANLMPVGPLVSAGPPISAMPLVSAVLRPRWGTIQIMARQACAEAANCRVIVMPGLGHVPHLESPDGFHDSVLEFFRS